MKINYRKIGIGFIFACLLSLPYFNSDYTLQMIDLFFKSSAFFVLLLIMLYNIKYIRKVQVSYLTIVIVLYCLSLLFSTIINKASIRSCIAQIAPIILIGILFDYFSDNIMLLLSSLMPVCEIVCYLNLLTILLYPNGLYDDGYYWQNWVLGYKNKFSIYLIVVFLVAYAYKTVYGRKIRSYALYFAGILSAILVNSTTQIVGYIILLFLFVLIDFGRIRFNPYSIVPVYSTIYLSFVIWSVESRALDTFLATINKERTYTGRTELWRRVISLIIKSPIWGYGVQDESRVITQLGVRWGSHAHNIILQILFQGGIISFLFYALIIYFILIRLNDSKNSILSQGAIVIVFTFFIMGLMENMGGSGFTWVLFYFCYYSGKFEQVQSTENRYIDKD